MRNLKVLTCLNIFCLIFEIVTNHKVNLAVWESSIDRTIESTKHLPEKLAETGTIGLTSSQLSKKMGALYSFFISRVNLFLSWNFKMSKILRRFTIEHRDFTNYLLVKSKKMN